MNNWKVNAIGVFWRITGWLNVLMKFVANCWNCKPWPSIEYYGSINTIINSMPMHLDTFSSPQFLFSPHKFLESTVSPLLAGPRAHLMRDLYLIVLRFMLLTPFSGSVPFHRNAHTLLVLFWLWYGSVPGFIPFQTFINFCQKISVFPPTPHCLCTGRKSLI